MPITIPNRDDRPPVLPIPFAHGNAGSGANPPSSQDSNLDLISKRYSLHWLRENGSDTGTLVNLASMDRSIRERVAALTSDSDGILTLRLPFFDAREWRARSRLLRNVTCFRDGDVIRGEWPSRNAPLRDRAACLRALHPAWRDAPRERDRGYFRTWQRVSVGLQTCLRRWISQVYFADLSRCEHRDATYSMLVYSVSRPIFGYSNIEFAYDIAHPETLPTAMRHIGCATQAALAAIQARLTECGNSDLAHRYAPFWYEDVIQSVREKPARLFSLLGAEGMLINAVIHLGTCRDLTGVKPFARAASLAMRSVLGVDMRPLSLRTLEQTTKLLLEASEPRKPTSRSRLGALRPPSSAQGTSGHCTLGSAASR